MSSPAGVAALDRGVAGIGATGGLQVPSAYALQSGEVAGSVGNDQDPKLGTFSHRRNYALGFGLGGGVEVFGRLVDYQNPGTQAFGAPELTGPRDLSANVKWQLPLRNFGLPRFAIGATDVGGGAVLFRSVYAVASDEVGPLRWTIGVGRSSAGQARLLHGFIGGAEVRIADTHATALVETDGTRRHAGLRYYTEPAAWAGLAQGIFTVQRSFGATDLAGQAANATRFGLAVVLPLEPGATVRDRRRTEAVRADPLPSIVPPASGASSAAAGEPPESATQQLAKIAKLLATAGLDAVRVGLRGDEIVVDYEDHRFLHNDADALGVALGIAAELAPPEVRVVRAVSRKLGTAIYQFALDRAVLRDWLREETDLASVRATARYARADDAAADAIDWLDDAAGRAATHVRISFKPILNYEVGTDFGVFDYSIGALVRSAAPLWRGAQAYADVVVPLDESSNMRPGSVYAGSRVRGGTRAIAVQQSAWIGRNFFASVGAGRYRNDWYGAEGEIVAFVPSRSDTVHLRAQSLRPIDADRRGKVDAWSAEYRWKADESTWLEAGVHQYTDGARGPGAVFTRWFGDYAFSLSAHRGAGNNFVGVEFSLPLAPRQGMGAAPVQFTGTPRFGASLRTMVAGGRNSGNFVQPDSLRVAELAFRPEVEMMNSGRIDPDYLSAQLPRMRDAFYLYARGLLRLANVVSNRAFASNLHQRSFSFAATPSFKSNLNLEG